jgi:hypothetical protein
MHGNSPNNFRLSPVEPCGVPGGELSLGGVSYTLRYGDVAPIVRQSHRLVSDTKARLFGI